MDEQQRIEFGRRVRDARVARGWNQLQLAEAAGVAPNTVGSVELGKRSPLPQSVAAIINALELAPAAAVEVPADVDLVARIVTMWLMGIPEGDQRARAVLELTQFLAVPIRESAGQDDERPVSARRGRVAGRSATSSTRRDADVRPGG